MYYQNVDSFKLLTSGGTHCQYMSSPLSILKGHFSEITSHSRPVFQRPLIIICAFWCAKLRMIWLSFPARPHLLTSDTTLLIHFRVISDSLSKWTPLLPLPPLWELLLVSTPTDYSRPVVLVLWQQWTNRVSNININWTTVALPGSLLKIRVFQPGL